MQQPKVELRVHSMLSVSCSHTIWMCIRHHSWRLLTWIIHLNYVALYCLLLNLPSAKIIGRLHPSLEHRQLRKTPHSKQQKVKALEACVEEKASIDKLQSCQCQAHFSVGRYFGTKAAQCEVTGHRCHICIARCSSSMTQNDIYRFTVLTRMLHAWLHEMWI